MSEYCVLGDAVLKGEKRDLGMVTALFIARLIHHDLVISTAASWQWWLAISSGDYKDGLVYIDKSKTDGTVYDSKMLWALGNYSRFIKPGSQRVQVNTLSDSNSEVYVSAYRQNQKLVTVAVNPTKQDIMLDIVIKGKENNKAQTYVTSSDYNLSPFKQYSNTRQILVPAESVTTILSK